MRWGAGFSALTLTVACSTEPRPPSRDAGATAACADVIVRRVLDGGAAQAAGILPGDVLVRYSDSPICDVSHLRRLTRADAGPGDRELGFLRAGKRSASKVPPGTLGVLIDDVDRPGSVRMPALHDELLRMVEQDQRERLACAPPAPCNIDDPPRTARLEAIVRAHGWPGYALVGREGAHAAWLLAQHADMRPALQEEWLHAMEAAVARGDGNPADVAYLIDRVRVHQHRPQVYGTQFGPGGVEHPIEDLPHLDERRSRVGLGPFAEDKAQMGSVRTAEDADLRAEILRLYSIAWTFEDGAYRPEESRRAEWTPGFRALIEEHGWPRQAVVGDDAARKALQLLIAYPRSETVFRHRCLRIAERGVLEDDVDATLFAIATDMMRTQEGRPSLYGTRPGRLEDPANLTQRRERIGLAPILPQPMPVNATPLPVSSLPAARRR